LLFQRFLSTISNLLPDRLFVGDMAALARLDPKRIYVENVRSMLGVSTPAAKRICETAVRQGVFQRWIEVACPNGAVVAAAQLEEQLPETVRCTSEVNGEYEEEYLPTRELPKTVFYRLNDEPATR
jgi:hypothetical protein